MFYLHVPELQVNPFEHWLQGLHALPGYEIGVEHITGLIKER